jgi:hypothetical protein
MPAGKPPCPGSGRLRQCPQRLVVEHTGGVKGDGPFLVRAKLVWEEMRASSGLVPCCATDRANRKAIPVSPLRGCFPGTPRGSLGKLEQHEVDALERRCGHGGLRYD